MNEDIKTDKKLLNAAKAIAKAKGEDESTLVELIDEETYESPSANPYNLPIILQGMDVPSQSKGPFSQIDKTRWLVVIENLLVKGVKSGREISRLTGLSAPTACTFVKEVKDNMSNDLTPARINQTRELLYTENETIANFCWNMINSDPTANNVPQLLKIIGDTNSRRSRLMGVENINVNVGDATKASYYDVENAKRAAAAKLNINIDDLKSLGDALATKMISGSSTQKDEDESEDE